MSENNTDTRMAEVANGFQQSSRESQARHAAYTIYSHSESNHTPLLNSASTSINGSGSSSSRTQQIRKELKFSTVRRLFCLVTLFDLLLMAVLWFLYVNLVSDSLKDSLKCEVLEYKIQRSLFDFVIVALCRTVVLLAAYGLFRSKRWWTVAATTIISCLFLIAKVVEYDFGYSKHDDDPCVPDYTKAHPVDFIIAISSFIIPWIETWVLDFQVLPREKALQSALVEQVIQDNSVSERSPLLGAEQLPANSEPIRFYSPHSSQTSDIDSESDYSESLRSHASDFQSLPNSQRGSSVNLAASIQEQEYLHKAKDSLRLLDRILAKHEGWQDEQKKTECKAVITSCSFNGIKGKVYKLETQLPVSPEQAVDLLWDKVESTPSWNPTVLETEVLQQIDEHTDIVYTVSTGGPGNIVSCRDFVAVRNYWQRGDIHVCSSIAVEHPQKPPCSKYVRGFNGPTGWVIECLNGDPLKSKFVWILNTDLNFKVWTPQKITDTALCHVLMEICRSLQNKLQQLPRPVNIVQPKLVSLAEAEKASLSSFEDLEEHPPSSDSFGSV